MGIGQIGLSACALLISSWHTSNGCTLISPDNRELVAHWMHANHACFQFARSSPCSMIFVAGKL